MKFQDSSFNGLKVTEGTKSVTHARTHPRSKSNMPHQLFQNFFKVGGITTNLPKWRIIYMLGFEYIGRF